MISGRPSHDLRLLFRTFRYRPAFSLVFRTLSMITMRSSFVPAIIVCHPRISNSLSVVINYVVVTIYKSNIPSGYMCITIVTTL